MMRNVYISVTKLDNKRVDKKLIGLPRILNWSNVNNTQIKIHVLEKPLKKTNFN